MIDIAGSGDIRWMSSALTSGRVELRSVFVPTVLAVALGVAGCGSPAPAASVYFKASNPAADSYFDVVALSADGATLAVGAIGESSNATGIDGVETDQSAVGAGAVYVFAQVGGTWSQQAYIKASNPHQQDAFGTAVALSADGSTLVVGAPNEPSGATGINGDQTDRSANEAGAVYVFARVGATWSQQAYVKASNAQAYDSFGGSVGLSADGATLAVGAMGEDSGATGVNGTENDESVENSGAAYVFSRQGETWSQRAYFKPSNPGLSNFFGIVALSGDGATLAVSAPTESSAATGIDGDQADQSALNSGAAYVFARDGGTWSQQAYVKASNAEAGDRFGMTIALSGDGSTMAVGADGESSGATGVGGNQADNSAEAAGAAYVFARVGATWSQQAYVKASNTGPVDNLSKVALSADGATLAVAAPYEDSGATGIDGNQADNSVIDSGAVYRFKLAGGAWSQDAYLKPSNTRAAFDFMCVYDKPGSPCVGLSLGFGISLALSADGSTLAAGAYGDVSGSPGVNGDQWDTSAGQGAGAVYVF